MQMRLRLSLTETLRRCVQFLQHITYGQGRTLCLVSGPMLAVRPIGLLTTQCPEPLLLRYASILGIK